MNKINNIPKRRFPQFTDAWEQRKLGDIGADFIGGGTPNTGNESFWNGQIPWVQSSDIKEDHVLDITPKKFVSEQGLQKSAAKLIPKNSIAIVTRVGVGKVSLVPFDYATSQDFLSISNLKIDELFATYGTYRLLKSESKKVQGTSIKGITKADLLQKTIKIPTNPAEQTAIGDFFRRLDGLITLHQRKLEHTQTLKKGLLQKMFPQNGQNIPEIRFPQFTDDWELEELGKVLDLLKDGTHGTHKDVQETGAFLLSAKNIKNGKVNFDETDRKISLTDFQSIHKNFNLQKGDVLLTIVGSIGETAVLEDVENITFQRSVAYLRPKKELLSDFLFFTIQTEKFQNELKKRQVISAQPGIYLGDLSIIPIQTTTPAEQTAIGGFFRRLDRLITLHQRKLEHLKQLKKSLLQQMFV
ncbi:restriction endonuclease subunit S [Neisseria yangbaofengii]|uniref:restriction endonuclease subunit S n=1 Tax=Neisseria yangbaofengii TaxID=2709396 RepID=UPI0013EC869E|nr:restriction endonuclease subunit S [Neisseria yangbaofengii]